MASKKEMKLDGTSQQEHVEGEKLDGTSQQDHIDGEGYHIENHTTIYTEHEVEIDGVQLKERKETTTVTDDNEVNLGKTVIKHVRSIKGNADIWKQEDTGSLMCFKRDRDSQDSREELRTGNAVFLVVMTFMVEFFPTTRLGFFCGDVSIRYPELPETVSTSKVLASTIIIATILFSLGEYLVAAFQKR